MFVGLVLAALIIALVSEAGTRGRDLTGWAVILLCAALLAGRI